MNKAEIIKGLEKILGVKFHKDGSTDKHYEITVDNVVTLLESLQGGKEQPKGGGSIPNSLPKIPNTQEAIDFASAENNPQLGKPLHEVLTIKSRPKNNPQVIWKEIEGYDGFYKVSNDGRVRSLNGELKHYITDKGYHRVSLCYGGKPKNFKVHQLIAIAFLDHTPCGHEIVVDHIDNDKDNNHLDNLQLITNRENTTKEPKGKSKYVGVSWHKGNKMWRARIRKGEKHVELGYYHTEEEASEAYQNALQPSLISEGEIRAMSEEILKRLNEPSPMCRDCADENEYCGSGGNPCDPKHHAVYAGLRAMRKRLSGDNN